MWPEQENTRLIGEAGMPETREVGGKEWVGRCYNYEVTIPHPTKPGKIWITHLTMWIPNDSESDSPAPQITTTPPDKIKP